MPKPTKFYGFQTHDGVAWREPTIPGMRGKEDARKAAKFLLTGSSCSKIRLITYSPTQTTEYGGDE